MCVCVCVCCVIDCVTEKEEDAEASGFVFINMWVREYPLGFTSLNTEECTMSSGSVQRCSLLDDSLALTEHICTSRATDRFLFFFLFFFFFETGSENPDVNTRSHGELENSNKQTYSPVLVHAAATNLTPSRCSNLVLHHHTLQMF